MSPWARKDSVRPRLQSGAFARPLSFTVRRYSLSAVPPIGSRGGVWRFAKPASDDAIAALRVSAPVGIPSSYYNFLRITNGGEGDLGVDPGWFAPWPAEHVVQNNRQYQLAEWVPGLFGFGSNGGGECFAFDFRETGCGRIVVSSRCHLFRWTYGKSSSLPRASNNFPCLLACLRLGVPSKGL